MGAAPIRVDVTLLDQRSVKSAEVESRYRRQHGVRQLPGWTEIVIKTPKQALGHALAYTDPSMVGGLQVTFRPQT